MPSSAACCRVRCASAALLVPYATRSVLARTPEIDVMLTMRPPPSFSIAGAATCAQQKRPVQIHRQHARPFVEPRLQQRLEDRDAGVVDERIDPFEASGDVRKRDVDVDRMRDVRRRRPACPLATKLVAQLGRGARQRVRIDVD